VLLAHTKNDQAETVLIGLLRSAGLDAIAGMEGSFSRDGVTFLRPWLDVTREETTGICEDLGLEWWDDPTNGPDAIREDGLPPNGSLPANYPLRSRVRHDLMPYLQRFVGGDVVSRLSIGAGLAQTDKDYLNKRAQEIAERAVTFSEDQVRFSVGVLQSQHEAIRLRVIAHALGQAGIACSARHVRQIDRLITDWHGQHGVALPSGYSANRQKHVIRVCQDGGHANR